ncbi:MAG: hypothetical protein ACXADB_07750 [Candidatus Hermodarchaeia archaeon]|jgi:hypothetical protein
MEQRIRRHLEEINKCSQRGGRMLSVRDLLDGGTLNVEIAAYLLATISTGHSFFVGARPGGAGKTTVMAALLNFIPDVDIVATVNSQVIENGLRDPNFKCFIAHEIGRGRWYAYIWGNDVANYNVPEVLEAEGIDEVNLANLHVLIFMKRTGQRGLTKRRVTSIYENQKRRVTSIYENQGLNGGNTFKQLFMWNEKDDSFTRLAASKLITAPELQRSRSIIEKIVEHDLRTMEEIRPTILKMIKLAS